MAEQTLRGLRVLIVEDEYLLADDLYNTLTDAGAEVLGPIASVRDATAFIASEPSIDAAVLDVNLRGELVYPVADALLARGVPFAFATGYDKWSLPERFAHAPRVEKPFKGQAVTDMMRAMMKLA
jgi:DNA-binding response OmpR family regulator